MRRDESRLNDAISDAVELDRRTVSRAMAWSVPVVMAAVAAPAATGSQPQPPKVTATGTGKRGGEANARYVDFTLVFTSDQSATVTLVSLTPDDKWKPSQGETWPNKVVSLAPGENTVTFRLNRTGNAVAIYTLTYQVTGVIGTQSVTVSIA